MSPHSRPPRTERWASWLAVGSGLWLVLGSFGAVPGLLGESGLVVAACVLGVFGFLRLARVRAHAEKLRRRKEIAESRLSVILDAAADGIVTIDTAGRVQSCNTAAAKMFATAPADVRGRVFAELLKRPDGEEEMVRVGTSEAAGIRADGSEFPLHLDVARAHVHGEVLCTVVLRDLTDERDLQVKFGHAQKLESIGQLAAGIAHEINTPIHYVTDNMRFLEESHEEISDLLTTMRATLVGDQGLESAREKVGDSDLEYLLEEIPKAIAHCLHGLNSVTHIVRAMKEFTHPSRVEMTQCDLNQAIEQVTTVARNEWKYHCDLELELDEELPEFLCMQGELNQVLLNLIVNAVHAIEDSADEGSERGRIVIRTRHSEEWAEIRICDNGCGVPPEIRDRVFEPFFTTKEMGKGTGQGLAIAKRVIVDRLGGTIDIESEVGLGTTFVLRLPIRTLEDEEREREVA